MRLSPVGYRDLAGDMKARETEKLKGHLHIGGTQSLGLDEPTLHVSIGGKRGARAESWQSKEQAEE